VDPVLRAVRRTVVFLAAAFFAPPLADADFLAAVEVRLRAGSAAGAGG
jgi:hypothetical protein